MIWGRNMTIWQDRIARAIALLIGLIMTARCAHCRRQEPKGRRRLRTAKSIAVAFAAGGAIGTGTTLIIALTFAIGAALGNQTLAEILEPALFALVGFIVLMVAGGAAWFKIADLQEETRG